MGEQGGEEDQKGGQEEEKESYLINDLSIRLFGGDVTISA